MSASLLQRPLIGVTGPEVPWQPAYLAVCAGVWLGGGRPVHLAAGRRDPVREVDGLLLSGGTDVHPDRYGGSPKPDYPYDPERDAFEVRWLERARSEALPVLAVCRGTQLMNVAHGGTLHLDVRLAYEGVIRTRNPFRLLFARYPVEIREGSLLRHLTGASRLPVNALHTNSVDRVGRDLSVSAREPSGVVQAVEHREAPFYLGVQFHPELMPVSRPMRALFRGLVRAALERRSAVGIA